MVSNRSEPTVDGIDPSLGEPERGALAPRALAGRLTAPAGAAALMGTRSPLSRSIESSRDHDALDLRGALVDLGYLGVTEKPLHGILLDVTIAAEDLDCLGRGV